MAVLRGIERVEDSPWVIPRQKRGAHLAFLHGLWYRIVERARIGTLRIHDLRHRFASGGLLVGEGLPMIGKLLGHNKVQTTARYAHLANDPVESAANRIASRIAEVAGWWTVQLVSCPTEELTNLLVFSPSAALLFLAW